MSELFALELVNEINFLRDQPKKYKEQISKYQKDKNDKLYDIYLREGKLSVNINKFNQALELLDKTSHGKLITIEPLLSKICEKIYKEKIKSLKNYNNLQNDVFQHIEQITSEYGRAAGKISFIIDQGNTSPKPIVLFSLINNQSLLNSKLQLFGCFQENGITIIYMTRYFIPNGHSIDHLSDSCIEIEEEIIEEIQYEETQPIEDKDMEIDKDWGPNIEKVVKTSKIEEINGEIIKTIYVKKYLLNGKIENESIVKKIRK